ncbi:tRNA-intron endonuclease [Batrachochytrium salamandrivorans]|nr:tRNA-intron endonuclease [Batrachochytrium salamandrivorans]
MNSDLVVVVSDREEVERLWRAGAFGSSTRTTYFKPRFIDNNNPGSAVEESLQLNLMEARHLGIVVAAEPASPAPVSTTWRLDPNHLCRTYSKLRKAGWVVKNGSQFGSDFVLYAKSPELCHSSYCVTVVPSQGDDRPLPLGAMFRQMRAAEQTRKRFVLCDESSNECVALKRWVVRQEEPRRKQW